jgi:hypothetical protein
VLAICQRLSRVLIPTAPQECALDSQEAFVEALGSARKKDRDVFDEEGVRTQAGHAATLSLWNIDETMISAD